MRLLLTIFALTAGCTLEAGDSTFPTQHPTDVGVDATTSLDDVAFGDGTGAATMTGTWLQVHEASSCVVIDEQVTRATYLVHIEQQGRTLIERREMCLVELSPVLGLQIEIGPAATESVAFIPEDLGYVSGLRVDDRYTSSTEVSLWGVELDEPLTAPIPVDPEDPAIVDGDNDGHPGLTFSVVGSDCERYVAQRSVVRYFGSFTTPNLIDGDSVTVTDTIVLGSSAPLCGVSPRIQPNDDHSLFRMARIDGAGLSINLDANNDGKITCDEVLPYRNTLLEPRQSDRTNCD